MRRIAGPTLAALLLCLPATAHGAVTPTRSAATAANAMSASAVAGAAFTEITAPNPPTAPGAGEPVGVSNTAISSFPLDPPTFTILSAGDARSADPANGQLPGDNGGDSTNPNRSNAHDITTLRVDLDVPPEATCISFGFRFFTDEAIGASFNDGFIAELDTNNWTINPTTNAIVAPSNFAFDTNQQVISVHSEGATALSPEDAVGTGYANGTAELGAARTVSPGAHSVYFTIFDQGDRIVDSAVFLDRLALLSVPADDCRPGATADTTAPTVSLTSPANGSASDDATPAFSGSAGDAAGDRSDVTVNIGPVGAGAPTATLTATRTGSAWAVEAPPLSPGQYTAVASQSDISGNVGSSQPVTFTINAPPPPPPPPPVVPPAPAPVLGKSVVAGVVSGRVRVKGRNGKFRTLGANESIPLGSTVDATKGKVKLTSASGPGGAVQAALFYQGAFVVTQTHGSKPVTQLALTGALSCGKGKKASTSARKKVRRLWGDGKGRFRTKGKYGAATVRGTKWLTEDRCNGTLVRVRRGLVAVLDFARHRTVRVKKGKSYLARPKKKR